MAVASGPSLYSGGMDKVTGIQLFLRIVEAGSFSKAASEFGITQPTATKAVAAMAPASSGLAKAIQQRSSESGQRGKRQGYVRIE